MAYILIANEKFVMVGEPPTMGLFKLSLMAYILIVNEGYVMVGEPPMMVFFMAYVSITNERCVMVGEAPTMGILVGDYLLFQMFWQIAVVVLLSTELRFETRCFDGLLNAICGEAMWCTCCRNNILFNHD